MYKISETCSPIIDLISQKLEWTSLNGFLHAGWHAACARSHIFSPPVVLHAFVHCRATRKSTTWTKLVESVDWWKANSVITDMCPSSFWRKVRPNPLVFIFCVSSCCFTFGLCIAIYDINNFGSGLYLVSGNLKHFLLKNLKLTWFSLITLHRVHLSKTLIKFQALVSIVTVVVVVAFCLVGTEDQVNFTMLSIYESVNFDLNFYIVVTWLFFIVIFYWKMF